jgi:hypothetical protein
MNIGSSPRRLAALAAVIALVGALAFVAGRVAGAGSVQEPAPTTPSHTPGVPLPATTTAVPATPGSGEGSQVANGVPLGYTDDETGAVDAATAFSRVLGGPLLLDRTAYQRAVQTIAAPGEQAALSQAAGGQLTALDQSYHLISLASSGVPVSVTTVPLSYQVDAFTPQRATVDIWAVGVMAAAGQLTPTAVWTTFQYRLVWAGDWRLQSIFTLDAGWAPAEIQPTPATSDVPGQLGAYRRYPDAPG